MASPQQRSMAAILGIACAIGSFFVHHAFWGATLSVLAIVLGAIGFLMSISPRVKGGVLSLAAVGIGIVALAFSLLKGVFHILR